MPIKKKKINCILIIIVILLCILVALYAFMVYYPKFKSEKFLEKYGWEVQNGGKVEEKAIILSNEFVESEITIMQISASEEIGLSPINYTGKSFVEYDYNLNQIGLNNQLKARLWIYKSKIICAYIYHVESNVRIKYWSLDTPYQEILSDLNVLVTE